MALLADVPWAGLVILAFLMLVHVIDVIRGDG